MKTGTAYTDYTAQMINFILGNPPAPRIEMTEDERDRFTDEQELRRPMVDEWE